MMKIELKDITKNLLLADNYEKVIESRNTMIAFLDTVQEKAFSRTFKPIIEKEYKNIIEKIQTNSDADIEQERLKIICFLTSLNLLII